MMRCASISVNSMKQCVSTFVPVFLAALLAVKTVILLHVSVGMAKMVQISLSAKARVSKSYSEVVSR